MAASGARTLSYQWQYNEGDGWKDSIAEGAKTASVKVNMTEKYDGIQYRCVVKSSNGTEAVSEAATASVMPVIIKQPEDVIGESGKKAVFTVKTNEKGTYTYQWQYLDGKKWTASKDEGAKTDTLTVVCDEKNEGRKYRCVITSSNGASQTSEEVSLRPETVIVKQPEDVTVKAGEKAVFTVEGYGEGELTYEWYCRNNKKQSWEKVEGADTATLTVEADEKVNGYQYHCLVSAANGHFATTDAVELTVTGKAGRKGDANGDDKVNVADAVAVLQFIANKEKYPMSEQEQDNADCDGTPGITGSDAIAIQKADAGILVLE